MARYAIIRFGGVPPARPWESLSSVMLDSAEAAWDFADLLDHAQVYELVPVDRPGKEHAMTIPNQNEHAHEAATGLPVQGPGLGQDELPEEAEAPPLADILDGTASPADIDPKNEEG